MVSFWMGRIHFGPVDTAGKRCFSLARKEFLVLLALIYQAKLRLNLDKHHNPDRGIDRGYVEREDIPGKNQSSQKF